MTATLTTVVASAIILANQNDSTLFQPIAGPRYSNTTINQTLIANNLNDFIENQAEDLDYVGIYHKDNKNADLDIYRIEIDYTFNV